MKIKITEGMLIAFFPVFAFLSALAFEMGYADTFDYSHDLIDVDLKLMLAAMTAIVLFFAPLFIYCYGFVWAARRGSLGARVIALQMLLPLPLLVVWYMTGFQSRLTAMALLGAILTWLIPLARFCWLWLRHGFADAVEKLARSQGVKDKPTYPLKAPHIVWYDKIFALFMLAVFVLMLAVMARGVGSFVAHNKSSFSTFFSEGKEYAILSAYADRFVVSGVVDGAFDGNVYVFAKNSERLVNVKAKRYENFLGRVEALKESKAAMPPPAPGRQ